MEENVIVLKNSNGKKVPLITERAEDEIIITNKRDSRPEDEKNRIIIYSIDSERLESFKQIELPSHHSYLKKLHKIIKHWTTNFDKAKI